MRNKRARVREILDEHLHSRVESRGMLMWEEKRYTDRDGLEKKLVALLEEAEKGEA